MRQHHLPDRERTRAVRHANHQGTNTPMLRLVIIGAGQGGTTLLELLGTDPSIHIKGVADVSRSARGMVLAKQLKIPTTTDYKKLLALPGLDFIIDVTGNNKVRQELKRLNRQDVEVISGSTAKFMWQQIIDRVRRKEAIEQLLFQYQSIYDLGLKLTASQSLSRLLFHIVEDATKLTHTPAGSVALLDERHGQMYLGAVKGFSDRFSNKLRWRVRKGGLTHSILNRKEPLVLDDVLQHPEFDNPMMLREGIRSLMACPLIAKGKMIGILYVDDFIHRQFTSREASLFWLIGSIAATTIEKARLLENAALMAITDELTGLYNHRYFVQRLSHEVNRASRYDLSFALAMLDIDDFKHYNDDNGHLKGNEVLRQLSALLIEQCREVDVIARYGGEEFTIIMPETSQSEATRMVDRLREAVARHAFKSNGKNGGRHLTMSAGVATYPKHSRSAHLLIEQADAALYEAKRLGKNRVIVANNSKDQKKPSTGDNRKNSLPSASSG
jgi:diguanylate cyclase (GGDEF)-like protein